MIIRQHIPAFVDGVDGALGGCESTEELASIPFVKQTIEAFSEDAVSLREFEMRGIDGVTGKPKGKWPNAFT